MNCQFYKNGGTGIILVLFLLKINICPILSEKSSIFVYSTISEIVLLSRKTKNADLRLLSIFYNRSFLLQSTIKTNLKLEYNAVLINQYFHLFQFPTTATVKI